MRGKDKCKALKEIRKQIAQENDIEYAVEECKYQGDCKGTCPKCEADLRYLENELMKRQKLGKTVAIAGVSATIFAGALNMAGCIGNNYDATVDGGETYEEPIELSGDVAEEDLYECDDTECEE